MDTVKIYFNKTPLILAGNDCTEEYDSEVQLHNPDKDEIAIIIKEMQKGDSLCTLLTSDNPESMKLQVEKHFKIIRAGGGIVFNNRGEVLLIFRRGKWDLPKGKLEKDETIDTCALREVKEETGLAHLTVRKLFCITRHVYEEKNKQILKETHWYVMDNKSEEKLVPQAEEDISRAIWVLPSELDNYTGNTFPSISEIFKNLKEREIG